MTDKLKQCPFCGHEVEAGRIRFNNFTGKVVDAIGDDNLHKGTRSYMGTINDFYNEYYAALHTSGDLHEKIKACLAVVEKFMA